MSMVELKCIRALLFSIRKSLRVMALPGTTMQLGRLISHGKLQYDAPGFATAKHISQGFYACWSLTAGAPPNFIARQMENSDAQMVYRVYGSWMAENNQNQVSI
ncbi:hypothetical protein JV483_001047 [Escherichia coli]|nr:hypothetical protein [Escherichia coli]EHD2968836.1 hypothetical protein [Escherichia coli]NJB24208.1 hypothetical protein [Escherichia coli]QMD81154.1 hypothetical protein HVZ30_08450 [Escherichia coli]QML58628.1 hypothetical protein HVX31_08320 [Escherichia coli]